MLNSNNKSNFWVHKEKNYKNLQLNLFLDLLEAKSINRCIWSLCHLQHLTKDDSIKNNGMMISTLVFISNILDTLHKAHRGFQRAPKTQQMLPVKQHWSQCFTAEGFISFAGALGRTGVRGNRSRPLPIYILYTYMHTIFQLRSIF